MSFEHDHSLLVNDHDIWHAAHRVLLTAIRFCSPIVNWSFPIFIFDMLGNSLFRLVDTYSNNFDIISPLIFIFLEHVLVVLHWLLAWWTPSGPKINHPNLTFLVFQIHWSIASFDGNNVFDH